LVARVKVGKGSDWAIVKSKLARAPTGLHDLFIKQAGTSKIDVDWISFE